MTIHLAFFAAFLLAQSLWAAGPTELSLRWAVLEPAVAGRKVKIVLPSGVRIEGRVVAVEPEGLRTRITKTSDLVAAAGTSVAIKAAANVEDLPKYIGYGSAAVLGTAVAGYYLGKRADRRVTTIRIVR